MCKVVIGAQPPARDGNQEARTLGDVYLLKSGRHYKIGRSSRSAQRGQRLAAQLPERANLIHVIKTDDPPGIERYWHKRFAQRHKKGEWFDLTCEDVTVFKRRKFM
jgi:hypothetical protein